MRAYPHRILLCVLLSAAGCGNAASERGEATYDEPVVATVGGVPIYARDFVLNYELGFPHLRRGENGRLAYLNRVIDEKLMALEGRRQGLLDHEGVRRNLEDLEEELLVEQVFQRHVNDRVEVTEADLVAAMQRDRVSFRLRFLPARTLEEAQRLHAATQARGMPGMIRDFVAANDEHALRASDFESPYVTHHDLHPDLLAAVADLPVGALSAPVPYQGQYLLLEVVDVRREPVPAASAEARTQYEQVVFQQKARAGARAFIESMMKPLDVRIKPEPYTVLRDNLWRWYRDAPPAQNLLQALEDRTAPDGDALRGILDDVLITTTDGDWTVRDFLRAFPLARYPLRYGRTDVFESDLYDAVGLTLRDHYFVRRARAEGLGDAPAVQRERARWADKWVYRRLREHLAAGTETVGETLRRLRERYPVVIHHAVLDTLTLSPPHSAGLTLLKGHTLRPAFPVVDPAW